MAKKYLTAYTKGFTLLEVLIVVLILGILATLAVPSFEGAKKKAQLAQTLVGMSAITREAEYFAIENPPRSGIGVNAFYNHISGEWNSLKEPAGIIYEPGEYGEGASYSSYYLNLLVCEEADGTMIWARRIDIDGYGTATKTDTVNTQSSYYRAIKSLLPSASEQ